MNWFCLLGGTVIVLLSWKGYRAVTRFISNCVPINPSLPSLEGELPTLLRGRPQLRHKTIWHWTELNISKSLSWDLVVTVFINILLE